MFAFPFSRSLFLSTLFFPCLALAQSPSVVVLTDRIDVLLSTPVLSLDEPSSYAYLLEKDAVGAKRLVQLYFKVTKSKSNGVTLTNLECEDAKTSSRVAVDMKNGASACGVLALTVPQSRTVNIVLGSVQLLNASSADDVTASGTYSLALPDLNGIPGNKTIFFRGAQKSLKTELREVLLKQMANLQVAFKFSPDDNSPPYDIHVVGVAESAADEPVAGDKPGDFIKIALSDFLPARPNAYKTFVSLDKTKLPPDLQNLLDPDSTKLQIVTKIAAETTPDRDHANFFLDLTFTSYVNPFDSGKPVSVSNNGKRRNVGLFALTYRPALNLKTWGLTGGNIHWLGINPYLISDVSTLPLSESTVPTQIADGADLEFGAQPSGRSPLRGVVLTAGARHESDRDLKFQTVVGRITVTPLINGLVQNRAFRSQVAANRSTKPFVTAYSFKPTFGYEIGDVVRDRPQRLVDNITFQDRISRALMEFAMTIELKQYLTFTATDTFYHHWAIVRRPDRNYVEAKVEFSTGYLFQRHGARGLQHAIEMKFQRGEQAPAFKVVNVFSLGMSFVR